MQRELFTRSYRPLHAISAHDVCQMCNIRLNTSDPLCSSNPGELSVLGEGELLKFDLLPEIHALLIDGLLLLQKTLVVNYCRQCLPAKNTTYSIICICRGYILLFSTSMK